MGRARHIGVGGTGSARVGGDPSDFEASTASTKGVLAEEGGPAGGRGGMDSVIRPGTVTMDSMAEARVRFLTAVKAHFTERYRHGWLSSMGLRVLKVGLEGREREGWERRGKGRGIISWFVCVFFVKPTGDQVLLIAPRRK